MTRDLHRTIIRHAMHRTQTSSQTSASWSRNCLPFSSDHRRCLTSQGNDVEKSTRSYAAARRSPDDSGVGSSHTICFTTPGMHFSHINLREKSRNSTVSFRNSMLRSGDLRSSQEKGLAPTKCRNVSVVFAKQAQNILRVTTRHLEHESFAVKHQARLTAILYPAASTQSGLIITKFIAVDPTEAQSA